MADTLHSLQPHPEIGTTRSAWSSPRGRDWCGAGFRVLLEGQEGVVVAGEAATAEEAVAAARMSC
jgi:hypothetical protein